MKIYISGPMTGYPEFNYPAFNEMEKRLKALGFDVFNPASIKGEDNWTWKDYMKPCIKAIPDCDGIVMLENSEYSNGAMVELDIARALELTVIDHWEIDIMEREIWYRERFVTI